MREITDFSKLVLAVRPGVDFDAMVLDGVPQITRWRGPGEPPTAAELAAAALTLARMAACADIDAAVGRVRLRWITETPGQTAIYQAKAAEARAVLAALAAGGTADPAAAPHLARDAARKGSSLAAEAQLVAGLEAVWLQQISPPLEDLRLGGKERVQAAGTAAAIAAVTSQVEQACAALLALPDGPALPAAVEATVAGLVWPAA